MLKRGKTVEEIVEVFRTYRMEGGLSFEPRVYRQSRSSSRQSSVEPEEELADKLSFKVKTRDNGNTNETRIKENTNQNKNSVDDLKRSSEPKDNTDLHTNASGKINGDGDTKDTKELQESYDVETMIDVVKEKGWGNATAKMEQSLSNLNLDNMVRNVETENRIVEKLSKISERKGHEPDQDVSTNINFCENMTENSPPRNVFDLVDADFIKRMIPFMHPKSRNHTFKYFLDKVDEVVEAVGEHKLLNSEILDLMQFR